MVKRIIFSFLALFCIFSFGCQSSSKKGVSLANGVLRVNIQEEPPTLDPRKARELVSKTLSRMLFDGLVRINREEKAELALAERVEVSSDLKTYTFYLREAKWSNQDPVTAFDFVYAWRKMVDPRFVTDCSGALYVVKNGKAVKEGALPLEALGVTALDGRTLQVELEHSMPYFLELLAEPSFFPVNARVDQENPTWATEAKSYVGNGPFCLKSWRHQNQIALEKNPSYWDALAVRLQGLLFVMVKEETELQMFEKKEIDWVGSPLSTLPVDALEELKREGTLKSKPLFGTCFLRVNVQRAPLHLPELRRALALAIHREAIVTHVTRSGLPATALVPPSHGLCAHSYFRDGDVRTAKELFSRGLEAQDAKMGSDIVLLYRNSERNHLIAQALQQQWFDALGVRVKLEAVERKVCLDRISKQDYQLALGSWIADFNDPISFLEIFKSRQMGTNNTDWENATYAQLLEESSTQWDQEKRRDLLVSGEKILMEEMPIIPIFHYTMLYMNQAEVEDVLLSSTGNLDFKWAYIR